MRIAPAKKHSSPDVYNVRNPLLFPLDEGADVNACRALRALYRTDPVPEADAKSTPLFRDVSKSNKKSPLVYRTYLTGVRSLLASIDGIDRMLFGMHSFRIGGATTLFAAGCDPSVIMAMGRWSSDIYKLYCRANTADLARWQRALGRQSVTTVETAADLLRRHNFPIDDLSAEAQPNDHPDPDADIAADFDPDDVDCDD